MIVELCVRYWSGDHEVGPEDATALLLEEVFLDGGVLPYDTATISWNGRAQMEHGGPIGFMALELEGVSRFWIDQIGPERYLMGTDPLAGKLVLPISILRVSERVPA